MPNDRLTRIPADAGRINICDPRDLSYWTATFGCTAQRLIQTADKVGCMAGAIANELLKASSAREASGVADLRRTSTMPAATVRIAPRAPASAAQAAEPPRTRLPQRAAAVERHRSASAMR